jgi:hypothetical protein
MDINIVKPTKLEILEYYSRDDVLEEILKISNNQMVVIYQDLQ